MECFWVILHGWLDSDTSVTQMTSIQQFESTLSQESTDGVERRTRHKGRHTASKQCQPWEGIKVWVYTPQHSLNACIIFFLCDTNPKLNAQHLYFWFHWKKKRRKTSLHIAPCHQRIAAKYRYRGDCKKREQHGTLFSSCSDLGGNKNTLKWFSIISRITPLAFYYHSGYNRLKINAKQQQT